MAAANPRLESSYSPQGLDSRLLGLALQNPLEETLGKLERVGQQAGMALARDKAQSAVLSGENPSDKLPISAAALAYNEAAHEAYAVRTEGQIKTKVAELSSQFTGRNPTDAEGYAKVYDSFASTLAGSVPDAMRGRVQSELAARRAEALAGITRRANEYQFQLHSSEIQTGIKSDVEEAATRARLLQHEAIPAELLGRAFERIDKGTALGLWTADEAGMQKQEAIHSVQAENIFGTALAQGSLESTYAGINSGKIAPELPVKFRDHLASQLSREIGHRHAMASAANAEVERGVRANTYIAKSIIEANKVGAVLTPEQQNQQAAMLVGKMEIAPDAFDDLRVASMVPHIGAAITSMPLADAEAYAHRFGPTPGKPFDVAQAKVWDMAQDTIKKQRQVLTGPDPIQGLMDLGKLADPGQAGVAPMSFDTPENFTASLADRVRRVGRAEAQYKQGLPLFTQAEVSQMRDALDGLDAGHRVAAIAAITEAASEEQASATFRQLDKAGATHYAIIGETARSVGFDAAKDIAIGGTLDHKTKNALLKAEGVADTTLKDFNSAAGDLFRDNEEERTRWFSAARDLYSARAFRTGKGYDKKSFQEAVKDAVGGLHEVTTNGPFFYGGQTSKLPGAKGIDYQSRISSLSAADIEGMGGTNLTLPPDEVAKLIRETGGFTYNQDGSLGVTVQLSGGMVRLAGPDGQTPFRLKF